MKYKTEKIPLEDILKGFHPKYSKSKLRVRLIKEGYKEHQCEKCLLSEWLGGKIPLELHHKDGNSENHSLENLEILCPNCHALTDTYGSKNISDEIKEKRRILREQKEENQVKIFCNDCKNIITTKSKTGLCLDCYNKIKRNTKIPDDEMDNLIKEVEQSNYSVVGKKYGMSGNGIKKRIKNYQKSVDK